jgi:hypothetical protein
VQTTAAIAATTLLGVLAVFQLCLALGAPWGRFAWGGQHPERLPAGLRAGSAVSIVLYGVFALVLLGRAGVVDVLPDVVVEVGTWVLLGYFALGVLMNGISRSKHERAVMTPVTLLLAVLTLVVALGPSH